MPSVYEPLTGLENPASGMGKIRGNRHWKRVRARRLEQHAKRILARLAAPKPGDDGEYYEGDPTAAQIRGIQHKQHYFNGQRNGRPAVPVETPDNWYPSVMAFARALGLPASTADRWVVKGTNGTRRSQYKTRADWEARGGATQPR